MTNLTITTDHKFRDLKYRSEVPTKVLSDQFDHLDEDDISDGFFKYRGYWYHITDFMRSDQMFPDWDGYHGDGYFSGVLIKLSRDGEQVIVGRYMS